MVPSMRFFKALYLLLPLALTGHTSAYQKYSTWMLESIISRGEGISATNGLLGEIQKVHIRLMSYQISCDHCRADHLKGDLPGGSSCGRGKHQKWFAS